VRPETYLILQGGVAARRLIFVQQWFQKSETLPIDKGKSKKSENPFIGKALQEKVITQAMQ
jgi:hypothetical protein